ncbi:hypothetical protein [Yersinia rohdei]|uniref:Uncharacterized protein n=1 Tax=Yersinia rohdei TaxID=29485 RepID=A0A0U1HQW5_YERRO|nr:hypothetical protein [Yersinia rohdei]CQI88927.1 Uncharacterised protein [Yersinia rohdei]
MITLILVASYFWMAGVVSEWAHDINGSKETVMGYAKALGTGITWPYWILPIWWKAWRT